MTISNKQLVNNIASPAKPFLRWAGGKSWLLKHIDSYLPNKFNHYHEPFVGGGSVFIYLKSKGKIRKRAYLSDNNKDLINSYNVVKNNNESLIDILNTFKNEKEFYYMIRDINYKDKIRRAAQFIFLNRTSFNGIYRVNLEGKYNVPYGFKQYKQLFDYDNLRTLCGLFRNCFFKACDFEKTLNRINKNDFVFLDPPYTVMHENNGFIKYNQKLFAWKDQKRLKEYIEVIKEKEAYFILTNAAHESIHALFNNVSNQYELNRHSLVGGKGANRKEISEFIFTNCNLWQN